MHIDDQTFIFRWNFLKKLGKDLYTGDARSCRVSAPKKMLLHLNCFLGKICNRMVNLLLFWIYVGLYIKFHLGWNSCLRCFDGVNICMNSLLLIYVTYLIFYSHKNF